MTPTEPTTINAAAFAPKALRRASPKPVVNESGRRREPAEHAENSFSAVSANSALNVVTPS